MTKYVYGFRFYSGRETTWGNTGRIAGELHVFHSIQFLNAWLENENRSNPCGCGGGERIRVSRKEAIKMMGIREFLARLQQKEDDILEMLEDIK